MASEDIKYPKNPVPKDKNWKQQAWTALKMPIKIASLPSIFFVMFTISVMSGWFNVMISSLGTVYQELYHFPASTAGFGYIAIGIGSIFSLIFGSRLTKRLAGYLNKQQKNATNPGDVHSPDIDHRNYLPIVVVGMFFAAVGWIVYGWACQNKTHWMISMIGLFVYGLSATMIRVTVLNILLTEQFMLT
jgi:hypothetical protein